MSAFRKFLHLSFRQTYSRKTFYFERFTKLGVMFLIALAASAAVGLDTNRTLAFQAFTFILSIIALSGIASLFFRLNLKVKRFLPRFGTVNQPLAYRIEVLNQSKDILKSLAISEKFADPRPSLEKFMNSREPEENNRNRFDRAVGYHRWLWLIALKTGATFKEQPLNDIGPGSKAGLRMELTPNRRGILSLDGLNVSRPDPFGLFKSIKVIKQKDSILVLPKRYSLPAIDLPGVRKHQPGGMALASSIGESEEVVSLRDYNPGDPLRRIHWRSWAKTGKPIVKEFQEEFFVRHALILDTFHQTPGSDHFEEAVSLAASLISAVPSRESLLDLMFVGPEAYSFTTGRGLANTDRMLEILASVTVCSDKPFSRLLPMVTQKAALLSTGICIFLSWDKDRQNLAKALKGFGLPLKVFVVVEKGFSETLDPGPMKDDPFNFHVLETGRIQEGLDAL